MELSEEKKVLVKGWMLKSPPFATESSRILIFRRPKPLRPRWRRRYFVLYRISGSAGSRGQGFAHCLLYYKSKQMAKVKGSIDLDKARNIVTHVIPPDSILSDIPNRLVRHFSDSQLPFFQLETKHKSHDRTYFFLPDSDSQMEAWARSISKACGLAEDDDNTAGDDLPAQPLPFLGGVSMLQTSQFPGNNHLLVPQQPGLTFAQTQHQRQQPPQRPLNLPKTIATTNNVGNGNGPPAHPDRDSGVYKSPAELTADSLAEDVYRVPSLGDPADPVYGVPDAAYHDRPAEEDAYGQPVPLSAEQQQQQDPDAANAAPPRPPPRKSVKPAPDSQADVAFGEQIAAVPLAQRSALSRIFTLRKTAQPQQQPLTSESPPPMPLPRRRQGTNTSSEEEPTSGAGATSDSESGDSNSGDSGSVDSDLATRGYAQLDFSSRPGPHRPVARGFEYAEIVARVLPRDKS